MLLARTVTVHEVYYDDFEQYVSEVYGKEFSFAADQECGNDTSHSFIGIRKASIMLKHDKDKVERFRATGKGIYLARLLLQDMVHNGLAPEGDYLIYVSW